MSTTERKRKKVIDMTADEARSFFLKESSYLGVTLPAYFHFNESLAQAEQLLHHSRLEDLSQSRRALAQETDVNYRILVNKDGSYSWRPLQIIHPIVYVDLVNLITEKGNWSKILHRFSMFQSNDNVVCISIPVESNTNKSDKEETILNWWENLEQASIKYSLEYNYCIRTDVTNCYGSIYTHSISWAIHGKEWSKNHRKPSQGLGNKIDSKIQNLQNGQTNGIPQAGTLFDFVAEIVMGYSDLMLFQKLSEEHIENYKVIRYRDDYRIFSKTKDCAERVTKILADVLSELNMHFNSKKTSITEDIITSSIKPDKLYWLSMKQAISIKIKKDTIYQVGLQKHLILIYQLAEKFPNSGSLTTALLQFKRRIDSISNAPSDLDQLLSIIEEILIYNPKSIDIGIAVLSKLLTFTDQQQILELINKIMEKFSAVPNTDLLEIWLQRVTLTVDKTKFFSTKICQKVSNPSIKIWNSSWLKSDFNEDIIIDAEYIAKMKLVIPNKEVALFHSIYY